VRKEQGKEGKGSVKPTRIIQSFHSI